MEGICEKLEESNKKGNMKQVFQTVKTLTKTFRPQLVCVNSKEGEKIKDKGIIAERWREYCEELSADNEEVGKEKTYTREPAPLRSEVARAIKEMANGKSAGPDEVPAELFKYAGERTLDKMHRICTALWETGEWPEDRMNSIFVPIAKKGVQALSTCLSITTRSCSRVFARLMHCNSFLRVRATTAIT